MEVFRADAGVVGAVDEAAAGDAKTRAARGDMHHNNCIRCRRPRQSLQQCLWNQQAWTIKDVENIQHLLMPHQLDEGRDETNKEF